MDIFMVSDPDQAPYNPLPFGDVGGVAEDAAKWLGIIGGVVTGAGSATQSIAQQQAADKQYKADKAAWEKQYPGVPYPVANPATGTVGVQAGYNPATGQVVAGGYPGTYDPRSFMEKYGTYVLVGGGITAAALMAYLLLKSKPTGRAAPAMAGLYGGPNMRRKGSRRRRSY